MNSLAKFNDDLSFKINKESGLKSLLELNCWDIS